MYRQITREDLLESREIVLYDKEILYVAADGDGEVYGITAGRDRWFHKANYWDYYDSEMMLSYLDPLTPDEAAALLDQWGYQLRERKMEKFEMDNLMLEDAVRFAVDMHQGQLRKGTQIPYIFHPLEVLGILREMKADANLQVAGVLHDTIEDTEATYGDILDRFGSDVADLVNAHSEDKSKSWEERKTHAIEHLAQGDRRLKMLVMADKVSNLRSIAADYEFYGPSLWNRFNAPMVRQSWYYSGIQDALWDMQNDPCASKFYWEMVGLYKDVFVNYFWRNPDKDGNGEALFQVAAHGECVRLDRGNPQWKPSEPPNRDEVIGIGDRHSAEELEDEWSEPFWAQVTSDLHDGSYTLIENHLLMTNIGIKDSCFVMSGEFYDAETGYEYFISLDEENTNRLIVQLRIDHGIKMPVADIFERVFGTETPSTNLMNYCEAQGIEFNFTAF